MGPAPGCKSKLTGLLYKVYTDMTPARGDDITALEGFKGFPDQHPDVSNVIIVPIILRGEVIGELIVTDKMKGERFTSDDEDLLLTIAFHSAFAIEKVMLHNEILKMASMDGLTGLNNHRTFQERLENEIERVKRYDRPFSLLMLDIDYFKDFNDTYGHQVGDDALKSLSAIMMENIRNADMAARYGGEEFAIILSETPLGGALQTAERIRKEIENYRFRINGKEKHITVSIGVASFPDDGSEREKLIEAADKALYFSKRSGRNKVCTYR
jgi:two-component system cell cycle response regulator